MFAALRERRVTEEQLAAIEAPVGLTIGAETPAEIAVSILGSIIRHHKGAAAVSSAEGDDERERQEVA